eukprot:Pgem_evm1s780
MLILITIFLTSVTLTNAGRIGRWNPPYEQPHEPEPEPIPLRDVNNCRLIHKLVNKHYFQQCYTLFPFSFGSRTCCSNLGFNVCMDGRSNKAGTFFVKADEVEIHSEYSYETNPDVCDKEIPDFHHPNACELVEEHRYYGKHCVSKFSKHNIIGVRSCCEKLFGNEEVVCQTDGSYFWYAQKNNRLADWDEVNSHKCQDQVNIGVYDQSNHEPNRWDELL